MKKQEVIEELGRPFLRPIGFAQGVFLLAVIISPFLWIWGSGDIAWKTALSGLIGVLLAKFLDQAVRFALNKVADEVVDKPCLKRHLLIILFITSIQLSLQLYFFLFLCRNNLQQVQHNFNGEKFLKALKTHRLIKKNIGLREAAIEVGVSWATLSRCENGKTPHLCTFLKICSWIGVSPMEYIKSN